jgi:phage gpG-like protein
MPDQNINIQVEITDNSPEVLAALGTAIKSALWAMGARAEEYAKQSPPCPVKIGRLRNSITHQEGEKETVIGSNVEYAAAQELGTSRGIRPKHF